MGSASVGGLCPRCLVRLLRATPPAEADTPDENASSPIVPPASLQFGDYELLGEIAHGGMGTVWRARQASLNRVVALKMILAGRFANDREVKRLRAEAEAAAWLDHPNIVPIYEVGEHEGRHYFAMKLIEGVALSRRISDSKSQISNRNAATLVATIARAVHHAHQRGILHRDLKPGNILLDERGEPHVTDFGLAKRLDTSELETRNPELTLSGAVLGTPGYMSPEAASGKVKELTTASDIYGLGAILYELLAGRPPFTGDSTIEVLRKVVEEEPVPPSRCTNDDLRFTSGRSEGRVNRKSQIVNPDLETICLKCLEKKPQRRYASAVELAEDLEHFLRGEPILARPVSAPERLWLWCRRRPARAAVLGALGVACVAAFFAWDWHRETVVKEAALQNARAELASQTVAHARTTRGRGLPGRRLENLPRLAAAAHIAPTLDLRNEAVACLALFDLRASGVEFKLPRRNLNLAFTPDLEDLALGRDGNTIDLYRLADGQRARSLSGWQGHEGWLRFSPNGRWLGARWYDGLTVFDVGRQEKVLRQAGPFGDSPERNFAFAPDGDRLALRVGPGRDPAAEAVDVLELPSGRTLHHWNGLPPEPICGLAWSPDGTRLAVMQSTWLTLLNATNGARVWAMPRDAVPGDHAVDPWVFAWHPRGDWLLVADKGRGLVAWRTVPVPWQFVFGRPNELPSFLLFGPDGDWFISSSDKGESVVWDFYSGRPLLRVEGRYEAAALSQDRRRIGYIREPAGKSFAGTWEASPSRVFREIYVGSEMRRLGLSADGKWLATTSGSNGFHLYHTGDRRRRADGWRAGLETRAVVVAPERGAVFTQDRDGWWRWPLRDDEDWWQTTRAVAQGVIPEIVRRFLPTDAAAPSLRRATNVPAPPGAGRDFTGRELSFQLAGGRPWRVLCATAPGHAGRFAVAEKARLLACTHGPNQVRVLDARTGATLCDLLPPEPQPVRDLAFDQAGDTLAVLTTAGLVQLWDIARLRRELEAIGLGWEPALAGANGQRAAAAR